MESLKMYVPLNPMGAMRTRSAGKRHYTPERYRLWLEDFVKLATAAAKGWKLEEVVPTWIDLVLYFEIPKSRRKGKDKVVPYQWHTQTPDADNATKAVYDGLVKAGLLPDDAQVCVGTTKKFWSDVGGIGILIGPVSEQAAGMVL